MIGNINVRGGSALWETTAISRIHESGGASAGYAGAQIGEASSSAARSGYAKSLSHGERKTLLISRSMFTESQNTRHLTFGWVTTWRTSNALTDVIREWLDDRFPHEVVIEHHGAMTAQAMERWCEANTSGEVVIAILSGDDGELIGKFAKAEDAERFKRRWVADLSAMAGRPSSVSDASPPNSVNH